NGNVVATTAATFGFRDFTDFTIDTPSFFTAGTNVLEVVLTNFDSGINPTGIQVLISETFVEITEVPVPAGILLLLSALGVAGITLRKRADA
ncbi:MAG: VPLPA-CTERM sorting domain-containing protein, partial [Pseudomonadota bacterium]